MILSFLQLPCNIHHVLMKLSRSGYGNMTQELMERNTTYLWMQVNNVMKNVSFHVPKPHLMFVKFLGEPIRFRVTAENFTETSPTGPETPDASVPADAAKPEQKIPFTLTVSLFIFLVTLRKTSRSPQYNILEIFLLLAGWHK